MQEKRLINIYKYTKGYWKITSLQCQSCKRIYASALRATKHICTGEKTDKRRTEFMPIHKTAKGYYWGSKGPFPTRQKAEEVAKAAYASGYHKPGEQKDKKSK